MLYTPGSVWMWNNCHDLHTSQYSNSCSFCYCFYTRTYDREQMLWSYVMAAVLLYDVAVCFPIITRNAWLTFKEQVKRRQVKRARNVLIRGSANTRTQNSFSMFKISFCFMYWSMRNEENTIYSNNVAGMNGFESCLITGMCNERNLYLNKNKSTSLDLAEQNVVKTMHSPNNVCQE